MCPFSGYRYIIGLSSSIGTNWGLVTCIFYRNIEGTYIVRNGTAGWFDVDIYVHNLLELITS